MRFPTLILWISVAFFAVLVAPAGATQSCRGACDARAVVVRQAVVVERRTVVRERVRMFARQPVRRVFRGLCGWRGGC